MFTEKAILSERFEIADLLGHNLVLLQPHLSPLLVLLHFILSLHVHNR